MHTIEKDWRQGRTLAWMLLCSLLLIPQVLAEEKGHQPIVGELRTLIAARPDLRGSLEEAIAKAGRPGILSLEEYYRFLDDLVTLIPTDRNLYSTVMEFYYIVGQSPRLRDDEVFNRWLVAFAEDWGSFLDTPASAQGLASFYTQPEYPSGQKTHAASR